MAVYLRLIRLFAALMALGITPFASGEFVELPVYEITARAANFREQPAIDPSNVWGPLEHGTTVLVLGHHGPWLKVRYGLRIGWIHQNLLRDTQNTRVANFSSGAMDSDSRPGARPPPSTPPPPAPHRPAANGKITVIIGDSHTCGPFGAKLMENLSKHGPVRLFCAEGTAPNAWAKGMAPGNCKFKSSVNAKFESCAGRELANILPQDGRVVLAFGTNTLPGASVPDGDYLKLAKAASELNSCTWVGPPHFSHTLPHSANMDAHLQNFDRTLSSRLQDICPMVSSMTATEHGVCAETAPKDGYHRTVAGAHCWADAVTDEVIANLNVDPQPNSPSVLTNDHLGAASTF